VDISNIFVGLTTAITAIVGVTIALLQLRGGRRDAQAARMAELSWQIYQAYESTDLRKGRRALNIVSRSKPIPQTGAEFGAMYVTDAYQGEGKEKVQERAKNLSAAIRRMLRFYHQVGILLDKKMIDPDFVFPLIGHGLETSEQGIKVATEWYQIYYAGESGNEKADRKRSIYGNALKLCQQYRVWKKHHQEF
jgi:hypothetical protein